MDRNSIMALCAYGLKWSLSARRAWIEIEDNYDLIPCDNVALRKESVDRNSDRYGADRVLNASLSARRAWIEIRV